MGLRKTVFATGELYHIFNHSVSGVPLFKGERECKLFLEAMKFYSQPNPPTRFSIYRTSRDRFPIILDHKIVTVISYCLMPNHFHFILRQEQDEGIRIFVQKISNSFAHYFCVRHSVRGHIFESSFKAVRIETEEQLLHLSRYIHLNPVSAYLVENPLEYPFSSYPIYMGKKISDFVDPSPVLSSFSSPKNYEEFVLAQKDYQRTLQDIKHLLLE